MEATNSSLVVVLGPTGSGKSDLALLLAAKFHGEVVSCDSVQVYRGLDVGSAKVPLAHRQGVPHHLLDVVDPDSYLTAGAYARLARAALNDISGRNRIPIVTGGTGFYLRGLLDGLSPAPGRDPELRQRLYNVAARRPATLHRLLRHRDAEAAGRIHPNDHQKLIRALELTASISPLPPRLPLDGYSVLKLGLSPPRSELYQRLNQRSAEMFQRGLLAETQSLLNSGLSADAKALQSLGYRQAVQVLSGELSLAEAIADCQTKTRQYAKRQITWFRREREVHWLTGFGDDPDVQLAACQLAADFLEREKPTGG